MSTTTTGLAMSKQQKAASYLQSHLQQLESPLSAVSRDSQANLRAQHDCHDTIKMVPYLPEPASVRQNDSIDEIASALLDDTESCSPVTRPFPARSVASLRSHEGSRIEAPIEWTNHGNEVKDNPIPRAQTMAAINVSRAPIRRKAVPVQRTSPSMPRRSSKRLGQGLRSSPRASIAGGITKPLPTSHTTAPNPLSMNPPWRLAPSSTMPLGKVAEPTDGGVSRTQVEAVGGPLDNDVDRQVQAMLAATEALKPRGQHLGRLPSSKTTSRLSRLIHQGGLLRKVSQALSAPFKFQQKDSKLRQVNQSPLIPGLDDPAVLSSQSLSERKSPITSMEIRLNEGENLSRQKVQQIVGGANPRKTVAEDAELLRDSLDDPFCESARARGSPTYFEHRLRGNSSSGSESNTPSSVAYNPFDSERVMDSRINDLLPSAPVATSTPRIRVPRSRVTSESPTKKARRSSTLSLGRQTLNLAQHEGNDALCRRGSTEAASTDNSLSPLLKVNHLQPGVFTYIPVQATELHKKHPSPNKMDLEFLEKRLRKEYPCLGIGPNNETQELNEHADSAPFVENSPVQRQLMPLQEKPDFLSARFWDGLTDPVLDDSEDQDELAGGVNISPMKKHPSPSKRSLGDLASQFRNAHASVCEDWAKSGSSSGGPAQALIALTSGTKSEHAQHSTADSDSEASEAPLQKRVSRKSLKETQPVRVPRAVHMVRSRTMAAFPPLTSMEVDELQWDSSPYRVGPKEVY